MQKYDFLIYRIKKNTDKKTASSQLCTWGRLFACGHTCVQTPRIDFVVYRCCLHYAHDIFGLFTLVRWALSRSNDMSHILVHANSHTHTHTHTHTHIFRQNTHAHNWTSILHYLPKIKTFFYVLGCRINQRVGKTVQGKTELTICI